MAFSSMTASPTTLGFTRIRDLSPATQAMYPLTKSLTISGNEDPGGEIALVSGATWLTVPAHCHHGVAFDVTVAPAYLPVKGTILQNLDRSTTITATSGAITLVVAASLRDLMGGPTP